MSTIRFEHRKDKTDKSGKASIRIIYQISGQRKYLPTPLKCLSFNWDACSQTAIYLDKKASKKAAPAIDYENFLTASEVKDFNAKLIEYHTGIQNIEKRYSLDKVIYTPQMVADSFNTTLRNESKKDSPEISAIAFIHQFVKDCAGTHKPGTLKVYTGLAAHLAAFQKQTSRKAFFEKLDIPFLKGFHGFLTNIQGMNNITAAKQMSTLKTLLNYARTMYKINVHPDYRDYKVSRKDSDFEVITITHDEFMSLYNLDLSNNRKLAQVRDVFCFSCATGLRYSDLAQLKREHIRNNVIRMTAAKTGQRLEIPLNPYSAAILEKYVAIHSPLPIISNQKTNDYIKELCKLAEIETPIEIIRKYGIKEVTTLHKKWELISIHTGRKTFTTLSLEKGIATQDVMAITGHTTYKSFKRYVDVTSNRKKAVMAKAWGIVPEKNLKAV